MRQSRLGGVLLVAGGLVVACGGEFEGSEPAGSGGADPGGSGGAVTGGSGGQQTGGSQTGGAHTGGAQAGGTGGSAGTPGGSGGQATGGSGGGATGGNAGTPGGSGGGSSGGSGGGAGGEPPLGVCHSNTDCVVRAASCCGECGAATRDDMIALSQDDLSAYTASVCVDGMGCDPCYMATDPALLALCNAGRCEVTDLLLSPIVECQASSDCRVRTRDCCECGGRIDQESMIAIRVDQEASYSELVCDPGTGCLECMPTYPPEAVAVCDSGVCRIAWASP